MMGWILIAVLFVPLAYLIEYFLKERVKNIGIPALIGFWVVANILDIHSSMLFISEFGAEREGNLIIRVLVEEFGLTFGLVIVKGGMVVLFAALFSFLALSTGDKILCLTISMIIFFVAVWNYINYFFIFQHTIGL